MKRWMAGLVAVAVMGLATGCSVGGGPKKVQIQAQNMGFNKQEIRLKVGVPVELVLVNKDTMIHDLSVDEIPVYMGLEAAEDDHDHGDRKEPDLHVSAQPGQKGTVIFAPIEEGTYTYYCTVPGHEMAGMTGTLIVSANGR
jgi:uncharacterized cupredoxin-like copper-binding protein